MKRLKIVPKGLADRVNVESGEVGECLGAMNVRECAEALEPMGVWKSLCKLLGNERVVHIDSREDGEYFLSCKGNVMNVVGKRLDGEFVSMKSTICTLDSDVEWAQSVGRFVVVGTHTGLKYLHYKDQEYKLLDFAEIAPQLVFGAVNVAEVSEIVPSITFEEPYSKWERLTEKDRKLVETTVNESCESLKQRATQNGAYIQPVAVRYAVRMRDDSYAWISAPVVVGDGLQMRRKVSGIVDSAMSYCGESELQTSMYNVGVTVVKPMSQEWAELVKSVDVLVSDELAPFEGDKVECRCDYITPNRYLTYWFRSRESVVAYSELVNPEKWRILTQITDIQGLTECRVSVPNGVEAIVDNMGALSNRCVGVMRSGLFTESLSRERACQLTQSINHDVVSKVGLSVGGRLYTGVYSQKMRNCWQGVQYWGDDVESKPCDMMVVARLHTANGEAVKVDRYACDYTPLQLNALIAYPDARAVELTVKVQSGDDVSEWTGELEGCNEQGYAYFLNNTAENVELEASVSFYEPAEQRQEEPIRNAVQVSAVANPFVTEQQRTVSQSEVLALAGVRKSVYSSTFGRYPVYVFTREGIFALSYKAKGDYSDAQYIDNRTIGSENALAIADEKVYFVSKSGMLCELSGKDVKELGKVDDVEQMAWVGSKKELVVRWNDNTIKVLLPSGRWSERSEGLRNVYVSNGGDAVGQTIADELVDMNDEQHSEVAFSAETYPIEVNEGQMIAPIMMTVNVSGDDVHGTVKLLGSDGVSCEWNDIATIKLEGTVCHPQQLQIYARPCRLLKVVMEGVARGAAVLRNISVDYRV